MSGNALGSSRFVLTAAGLIGLFALAAPTAHAQTEMLTATFLTPDSGVTANSYSGDVLITVSGVGQTYSTAFNDAFYVYTDLAGNPIPPSSPDVNPTNPAGLTYYQLTYSPNTLPGGDYFDAAYLSIVGGLPAYEASHTYTFTLNTGLTTPGKLHFGVSDGLYSDNSGAYTLTISGIAAVPEPGSVALLMSMGLSGAGFLARRRKNARKAA